MVEVAPHLLNNIFHESHHLPEPSLRPTSLHLDHALVDAELLSLYKYESLKSNPLNAYIRYPSFSNPRTNLSVREIIEREIIDESTEDAFFVADLGSVIRQHEQWRTLLPRIEPFYAVKCNSDLMVLKTLLSLGTGFDCASRTEIETMLRLGASSENIIYANPCKQTSQIRYARDHNVHMMTFDNANELYKIKEINPDAKLVLRVLTDNSRSICNLGTKFGARHGATKELLELARNLDMDVIGISFHVGSGCFDATAFGDAVRVARKVFDEGAEIGFRFTLLDVGGGFPGLNSDSKITFPEIAAILGPAINAHFPIEEGVRVIAEPGRYYVSQAFTLSVAVTSLRVVAPDASKQVDCQANGNPSLMYYVNDGVYGSFNCLMFDHAQVYPQVLTRNGRLSYPSHCEEDAATMYDCSLWGPTCDSMDCLTKNASLPELQIGDWLFFENMGAYTLAAASTFNGFSRSRIIYTNTENTM